MQNTGDVFACNSWTNDRKQKELAATSTDGAEQRASLLHWTAAPLIARLDMFRNKPYTIDALKDNIQLEITNTENNALQRMADNISHLQMCPTEGGGHLNI